MSVPQDRNQTQQTNIPQPDTLPPDVKVIECSCQNSDWMKNIMIISWFFSSCSILNQFSKCA